VTIEPEFSLDQPRQINHLAADGVLAKDSEPPAVIFQMLDAPPMARRPGARTLAAATAVVLTDRAPAPVQDAPYSQAIRLSTTPDGRRDEQTERVPTNLKAILEAAAAAATVSSRPPCSSPIWVTPLLLTA